MENSSVEANDDVHRTTRRKYLILFIVKSGLGICLLTLGGLGVRYTRGQTDTFGPPYFLGAFIVGSAFVLSGLMNILIYCNIYMKEDTSASLKDLPKYACGEVGFTVVSVLGGFIGIFFVAIFGVPKCDPDDFFSHCNYTRNISQNHTIAILILLLLIVSEIVAIGSIVVHCRSYGRLGYNNAFGQRRHFGIALNARSTPTNVTYSTAHYPPSNYSGQSQVQNFAFVHPPAGYPQYQGQAGQNTQGGSGAEGYGQSAPNTVNDLQEQNRLLREQIALQQQQLNLMQQQQLDARAPSPNFPPPPSYDSCIQDPSQINLLQEQNKELQNRYQSQQERLENIAPPCNIKIEPSAPPM